ATRKNSAQNPAAIHGIRRQQIEQSKIKISPDDAPQQCTRVEEWAGGQRNARHSGEQNERGQTGNEKIYQRPGNRDADVTLPGVDRIWNGVRFVEDGDSADRQQNDGLRRNARTARYQSVTQLVQDHTAEKNTDQAEDPKSCGRILSRSFGAKQEEQQKREGPVNANLDSEETSDRDGPTAHRHAYQYSIYLDTDWCAADAKMRNGRTGTEDQSRVETRLAASPVGGPSGDGLERCEH